MGAFLLPGHTTACFMPWATSRLVSMFTEVLLLYMPFFKIAFLLLHHNLAAFVNVDATSRRLVTKPASVGQVPN